MIAALSALSVRHRSRVLLGTLVLAVVGMAAAMHLRFDALPDVTGVQVLVLTTAPGLTPEEVELRVTRPVELATMGLPDEIGHRSISRYGLSSITIVFDPHIDLVRARQLVAERLAVVATELPPGVDAPALGPMTGGLGEIFQFTLSSATRSAAELLELAELRVAPRLLPVGDIVEVNTWGGATRTYAVHGDPVRMAARHVTFAALTEALSRSLGTAAGASLPAGDAHVLLRGRALPTAADELASVLVRVDEEGRAVRVDDVATVLTSTEPRIGAATRAGEGEVVYLMAQMRSGANALEALARIHAKLPEVRAALPDDVVLDVVYDRGDLVGATLETVAKSLAEGGLLVILVLFAMLGSGRAGAIVASVIPLSMLGAVIGMVVLEIPGNLMSLGALDFGLLVDGAVVLVETVFHRFAHHRSESHADGENVVHAAEEVGRPIFFGVAIIVLVYVPILALEGVEGEMFRPMAITVVLALATSLLLSLTYVPAATAMFVRSEHVPAETPRLPRAIERLYTPILEATMAHPGIVVVAALAGLALSIVVGSGLGSTFMPQLDEGDLVVQTTRRADIGIDAAVERAVELERALRTVPEVRDVSSRIGSPTVATDVMGIEQADVFVALAPHGAWREGLTSDALVAELERAVRVDQPDVELAFTQPIQMRFNELVGGAVTDVAISIYGDDLSLLRRHAEDVAHSLEEVPGAEDVRVTSPPAVPLLDVSPRPLDAARLGFDPSDVLDMVRGMRIGVLAGTSFEGPLRIPVRVHLGDADSAFDARHSLVPTARGSLIPLDAVADVTLETTPASVSHEQASRRIVVGFNVRGRDLGSVVREARARLDEEVTAPPGHRLHWGGQFESFERARDRLSIVIPVVLLLVLGVLGSLFGDARRALLVFANVPFAAVGGVLAIAARSLPLSISAAVGFVALSGIAVLNGVVLVSRMADEERHGFSPREAAQRAALSRVRPVAMTALVAGLGFVPMMLARGIGSEVQAPLATVVVGGLVTSTLLTLIVLPTIYPWIARRPRGDAGPVAAHTPSSS